jgi:hypothetical protein
MKHNREIRECKAGGHSLDKKAVLSPLRGMVAHEFLSPSYAMLGRNIDGNDAGYD